MSILLFVQLSHIGRVKQQKKSKLFFVKVVTPSLNDVFEIKNELKKLHIEPFLHMPRYYKNAKKQIISWKKIIYTIKFCVLLPLVGKSAS